MKKLFILTSTIILASCTGHDAVDHAGHQRAEGIVISSARVLPPFPGRDTAAGYFEITNHGKTSDRLISATSPISESIEIHNHIEDKGVMKMRRVEAVELSPGETVVFKPGSFHLMMFKTQIAEGQDDVSITLNYEKSEPTTMIVDIEGHEEDENYGSSHKGKGYGSSHKDNEHKGDEN